MPLFSCWGWWAEPTLRGYYGNAASCTDSAVASQAGGLSQGHHGLDGADTGLVLRGIGVDPLAYFRTYATPQIRTGQQEFQIDRTLLTVSYRGKVCFWATACRSNFKRSGSAAQHLCHLRGFALGSLGGNPVRLGGLERRQNAAEQTRQAGLAELADAIDGAVPGHYRLEAGLVGVEFHTGLPQVSPAVCHRGLAQ